MALRLLQVKDRDGTLQVVASDDHGAAYVLPGVSSTYDLAMSAIAAGAFVTVDDGPSLAAAIRLMTRRDASVQRDAPPEMHQNGE